MTTARDDIATRTPSDHTGADRLLVDVDGTLAWQLPRACQYLDEQYGVSLAPEEVVAWDYTIPGHDAHDHIGGLIVEAFERDPEWYFGGMPPMAGAADALARLREEYHVAIATHRPPDTHEHTRRWLRDHDVPYDEFVEDVPDNKAALDGRALVDDYHGNVADALAAGMDGLLFDQPYSDHTACDGATVVDSWDDVLRAFDLA
ncbi:5' nucleotidase, NT5C type [Salinigranum sp. GCM10025319]|uniref:5' nucleotidase, NT5C type n=1 Tax=Salinigranum sp. GCM10025319 TaxID=3252687 RepID=UPI00360CFA90